MSTLKNLWIALVLCTAFVSCKEETSKSAERPTAPPMTVETVSVQMDSVVVSNQYPTNIEGVQNVEIRPFVSGFIHEINITEGAEVKKGDVLFRINDEPQKQALRAAQAQIKVTEANMETCNLEVERIRPLVEKNIMSLVELKTKESQLRGAEAQYEQAKANYETAKENLSYTVVRAPVDGVVGDLPYKLGSLVSSADPMPLTTVSNINNVFAYFTLNEKTFLQFNRRNRGMTQTQRLASIPAVKLELSDGTIYSALGQIAAINGMVNARTGGVTYKATFPNPNHILRSGSSGKVVMTEVLKDVILIPQKSVFEIQGKRFVYVVDENEVIHATSVIIENNELQNQYIVSSGLKSGDKIVNQGIIKLKDGMTIKSQS